MIGKLVSHYRVEEKLGTGGMAEVYRAVDERLQRPVALKFLPANTSRDQSARDQLRREAQAASSLDHPNICTIFEINETDDGALYIAMAFYEGETLDRLVKRGPLPREEALSIAAQVASGLAEAHRHGIVHRDVKPANLLLTSDGRVKILDFGIARLIDHRESKGAVFGTVPYMSPEQLGGKAVDHRTDIWSLGVVFYQLLTGHRPFRGKRREQVRKAILKQRPEPLADYLQGEQLRLQRILTWCLAKDPDDRYNHADELLEELKAPNDSIPRGPSLLTTLGDTGPTSELTETTSTGSSDLQDAPPPSIAVLPFEDLSAESDHGYLATGLAEELINQLAQIDGLRVIGRVTSNQAVLGHLGVAEIGERLGVATVLEGSLRVLGDAMRVSARLVDVEDGSIRWSETFDRERRDLLEIQDQLASRIASTLEVELLGRAKESIGFEAHRLYLKGRHCWNQRKGSSLEQAVEFFKAALDEEPDFARAHAGLADAYAMLGIYGISRPSKVMAPAMTAAQRAIELDDHLAEAYTSRACVRSTYEWDYSGAASDFRRAIELDPQYPTAHQWYAMNCLIPKQQFDDAIKQLSRAAELDPMSMAIKCSVGLYYYYRDQPQRAIDEFIRVLEIDGDFPQALIFLSHALRQAGRHQEAVDSALRAAELVGGLAPVTVALAAAHAASGRSERATWLLEKLIEPSAGRFVSPTYLAQIYASLGELDLSLAVLDRACQLRASELIWLAVEPLYAPLRHLEKYQQLLREVGLEVRW